MGKASKWIRNLLLGKKDDKINKKTIPTSNSKDVIPSAAPPPPPPVEKRRWSFGRSSTTDKSTVQHKSTRSFDSIITPQLVSQAMLEYANLQQHHRTTMVLPPKSTTPPLPSTRLAVRKVGPVENAAATKIQAYFRSYLARKALCALRGLVKLQALVRGHLVRKQTTAMVRCMNALMSIQVRARVNRIQMADQESYVVAKTRKFNRELAQENMISMVYREEMKDLKVNAGITSQQHVHLNSPQTAYSSGRVSVSRREHQHQQQQLLYPISLTSTYASSRMYDEQVEERSLSTTTHSTSQHYTSTAMYLDTFVNSSVTTHEELENHQLVPSYMAKTESSRAKVRSQSEPKQRPMKKKSRRTASNEGIGAGLAHSSSSRMRGGSHKSQSHWLVKLYRSSNSIKGIEFDETSTSTNNSSYCSTLVAHAY